MKPDLVIYHGPGCLDGATAAWAIWKRWPDLEFIPANYGKAPPDVAGKYVLIVDFSYKAPVLLEMAAQARGIIVLDHHLSAQKDLAPWARQHVSFEDGSGTAPGNFMAIFDMDKSGAQLAWEYAFPGSLAPRLVQAVQDLDLWRFHLADTREINALLASHDFGFELWDRIANQLEAAGGFLDIAAEGASIMRQQEKDRASVIKSCLQHRVIAGFEVPVVNAPHYMASEIGNTLAPGAPFAAVYYDTAHGKRSFSLRSTDSGEDVSAICAARGGGGHRNAAGFAVDLDGFTWDAVR